MTIVTFVLAAGCTIFVLISLLIPIAASVRLPLPVLIAAVGLTAGALTWLTGFELAGKALDAYDLWFVKSLALDTNSLLLIFLPPLLFEMSLGVSPRRLRDDVWIVLVMAVVAVVLATIFVGLAVASVSNVSLIACLLLGAAISTTDPAAVVTTFREIGAPRRLVVILEGESLLNDAAAIALFTLLVAVARADATAGPINLLASFGYSFGAGAMAGAAIALFASRIFPLLGASVVAEATLTVALAHGSYLLAEIGLGASGVVAVVFAGMTTRHFGVVAMGPRNWSTVMAVWTQIGFWAQRADPPSGSCHGPSHVGEFEAERDAADCRRICCRLRRTRIDPFRISPAPHQTSDDDTHWTSSKDARLVGWRTWRSYSRSRTLNRGADGAVWRGRPNCRCHRCGLCVRDASAQRLDFGPRHQIAGDLIPCHPRTRRSRRAS